MIFNAPKIQNRLQTVYTLRHAESEGNARGLDDESLVNQANHRFPITDLGIRQASSAARYVLDNHLIHSEIGLYTSGFYRAQQTMERVLEVHEGSEFKVVEDSRLDEWWKGIFHSLPKDKVASEYPNEVDVQKREGWHHYRPPQGQAGKDVEINLVSFLREVQEREIFIFGHGRSLSFLRRILTNQPVDLNCRYHAPKNGEIWKFERAGDYFSFESLFVPEIRK